MIQSLIQQMGQGQMPPMMPHDTGANTALLWVIIILLAVIIVYLWYNGGRKISEKVVKEVSAGSVENEKIDIALRLLNDNEKLVVQALIDHGGVMLQKDISYELELTRVQTHRTIQSLLDREIVTTQDHYNTKKVTLAKWLIL